MRARACVCVCVCGSGSAYPIQILTLVVVAAPASEPGSESEALQHKAEASDAFTQETSSQGRHCTARRSWRSALVALREE